MTRYAAAEEVRINPREHTVVVTGAAQGIGLAIAKRLCTDGWQVWKVDVDERVLEADADADAGCLVPVLSAVCDIADPHAVAALWARIDGEGSPVYAVVNNAGVFLRGPAVDINLADWNRVLAVNVTGAFLMAQQAARRILSSGAGGVIVSVASGQAFRPGAGGAAYACSKAGLVNLTRALAVEWGPGGIRANTVVPGLTDTAQPRAVKNDADFARAAASVPLRRLGSPDDVAALVSFLLSEDARHITGQAFAVNGGRLML